MNEEKIKLLDINIFSSIGFIVGIIILTILIYNDKLTLLGEKPLFDKDDTSTINIIARFFIVFIAGLFVYTSYYDYKLNQMSNKTRATKVSFYNLLTNEAQMFVLLIVAFLAVVYPRAGTEEEPFVIP